MVAPHFHGLYLSLELSCEGPRFTSIQEDGCDKPHQSPKQSHAEDHTEQIEATRGEDHC